MREAKVSPATQAVLFMPEESIDFSVLYLREIVVIITKPFVWIALFKNGLFPTFTRTRVCSDT